MAMSTEKMETTKDIPEEKCINTNLVSLKCLLFLFFGGIGCLFPFFPLHMKELGLNMHEIEMISMISPVVAILGPLIAGPVADRLAGRQSKNGRSSNGCYLRVMIAIACVMSAICYSLLFFVPTAKYAGLYSEMKQRPAVSFSCDRQGAIIQQERCKENTACPRWSDEDRVGSLVLVNCDYSCYPVTSKRWHSETEGSITSEATSTDMDILEGSGDTTVIPLGAETDNQDEDDSKRIRRYTMFEHGPPHLCFKVGDNTVCHVYTEYSDSLAINVSLKQAVNPENEEEWCVYPVAEYFECRIPPQLESRMAEINQTCSTKCDLMYPYTSSDSVLAEGQCEYTAKGAEVTFWMYLSIRSIADIFPTMAVALLDAAIVIATRETSCGRGDVGRQLAFGSLGFAVFGLVIGYIVALAINSIYYVPIGAFVIMMVLSAIVALSATGMPLSPPEWWWHTRSGMLALPMSAIKRYGSETAALFIVLIIMGTFWSAMNSYLTLYLYRLRCNEFCIGITMTIGAVPAFLFLWKSEHLVDYCGHSNLLITAFTVYILRFTGLSLITEPWWSLISGALEVFTLGIMWVTAILYLRHLVPRHLTVTAQALPVIAHFCIGRCIGAVIGTYIKVHDADSVEHLRPVFRYMAIAAAVVAALYFALYHGLLKPRCHAQTVQGPRQPPTIVEAMNGNGNYTPLRVYHNGMGRKGQFRY